MFLYESCPTESSQELIEHNVQSPIKFYRTLFDARRSRKHQEFRLGTPSARGPYGPSLATKQFCGIIPLLEMRGRTVAGALVSILMNIPGLLLDVIHQQILPQRIRRGEVSLPAAKLGNFLHEMHEAVMAGQ